MADVEKPEDKQTAGEDAPATNAESEPKKKAARKIKAIAKEKAAPKEKQASKTSLAPKAAAGAASAQPSEAKAASAEQPGVEQTKAAEGRPEPSPVAPETQVMEDRPPVAPPETRVMEDRPPAAPPEPRVMEDRSPAPSEAQVPEPKPAAGPSEAKAAQARPAAVPPPLPAERSRSSRSAAVALWGPLLIIGALIYALADEAPMPAQAETVQAPTVVATEDAPAAAEATAVAAAAPAAVAEGGSQMPGEGPDKPHSIPRNVELGPKGALSIPLAPSPDVLAPPAPELSEPSGPTKAISPAAVEQVPAVPLGRPEAPAFATMPELRAFDTSEVPANYPPPAGVLVGQDLGKPPPPGEEAWAWPGGPPLAGPWPGRYYPPPGPFTCSPAMGLCVAFFPYP